MTVARSVRVLLAAAVAPSLLVVPRAAFSQTGELRVEMGAARSLPPSGTDAMEASYGLVGIVGEKTWLGGGAVGFSLTGGRPFGGIGSDWAAGQVVGEVWTDGSGPVDFGLGARGYAFRIGRPFVYETTTVEILPQLRFRASEVTTTIRGEFGMGRSDIALHRFDGAVRRGTHDLWHRGVVAEATTVVPRGWLTAGAGYYQGAAGGYRRGFVEWLVSGPATLRVSGEVWDTPQGIQYAGGLGVRVSLWGGWSARADGGRGIPDPLIRAPRGVQGGGFLGYRILESTADDLESSMVSVGAGEEGRVRVRIALPSDVGESVELLGDFSDWEPQPLVREGPEWVIRIRVAPGTYHFGFQVDGLWYVPPEAPGRVADEWGQENATLVVPDAADVTEVGR